MAPPSEARGGSSWSSLASREVGRHDDEVRVPLHGGVDRLQTMHRALWFYRAASWLYARGLRFPAMVLTVFGRVVTGAWIPPGAQIGKGSTLGYGGSGVVIHSSAVIGENCIICPGVLIGGRGPRKGELRADSEGPIGPVIGDNVNLWQGSKVLGSITIGDGVDIGVNAVVIHDVPAGSRVVAPLGRLLN